MRRATAAFLSRLALGACCSLGPGSGPVAAAERYFERYGVADGLPSSHVIGLARDDQGFLWIGTHAGLVRFDGVRFERWAPGIVSGRSWPLATPGVGLTLVQTQGGPLRRITEAGLEPIPAGSAPETSPVSAVIANDGALWTLTSDGLERRDASGVVTSRPIERDLLDSGARLFRGRGGETWLGWAGGLRSYRADGPGPAFELDGRTRGVVAPPDGSLLLAIQRGVDGAVVEIRDGVARELFRAEGQPGDLVEIGDEIWASFDSALVVGRRSGAAEAVDPEAIPGGGPILLDREGQLWYGSPVGLFRIPAPTTAIWTGRGPGRASAQAYSSLDWRGATLVATAEGVVRAGAGPPVAAEGIAHRGRLCADAAGALWLADRRWLHRVTDRAEALLELEEPPVVRAYVECAPALDGGVWLLLNDRRRLFAVGGTAEPRRVREIAGPSFAPLTRSKPAGVVHQERSGRLWWTRGDQACFRDPVAAEGAWSCEEAPGASMFLRLVETTAERLLAATLDGGLLERTETGWRPVATAPALPNPVVSELAASPRGGLWAGGDGFLWRIAPDGHVEEHLGAAQGMPGCPVREVREAASGAIRVVTDCGVVDVGAEVRREATTPPPPVWTGARDERVALDRGATNELPAGARLELRFASLLLRDPAALRYRLRERPGAPWSEPFAEPALRALRLAAGSYRFEVAAALEPGGSWSAPSAALAIEALPPWWRRPWAIALAALAVAALAALVARARVARRLEIAELRERLARDLHDDIGAGLTQIAIASELLSTRLGASGGEASVRSREELGRIAETSRGLVAGMSDLVWALRPERDDARDLARRLRSFAEDAAAASGWRLDLDADLPAGSSPLGPERLRALQLAGRELLTNVAKHARADRVALRLDFAGDVLELSVEDDGVGPGTDREDGVGLRSLARRAGELGGSFELVARAGGGSVARFRIPRGSSRRRPRRLHPPESVGPEAAGGEKMRR